MSLTKSQMQKMNKDEIINFCYDLQDKQMKSLKDIQLKLDSLQKLEERLVIVESDLEIAKNINNTLLKKVKDVERRCWANSQYSRRECLEVVGIPESLVDEELDDKVSEVFNMIDADVDKDNFEACHRLKKGRVIVKFKSRKDTQRVLSKRKHLKDADVQRLNFPEGTKLYINESLCGYYRGLWGKCKILWKKGYLFSFWTTNGTVNVRENDHGKIYRLTHDDDLCERFPYINFGELDSLENKL